MQEDDMKKAGSNRIPKDVSDAFPGLTLEQFRMLGFCAYYGSFSMNDWRSREFMDSFSVPLAQYAADKEALVSRGLLVGGEVRPADYFRITIPIFRLFPAWPPVFERLGTYPTESQKYLWKMSRLLAAGDVRGAISLRYPPRDDAWRFLEGLLFRPEYESIVSAMPSRSLEKLLDSVLKDAFDMETLDEKMLSDVQGLAGKCLPHPEEVADKADAYAYFLSGTPLPVKECAPTVWSLGARAVSQLLRGELVESLELFEKAKLRLSPDCGSLFPDRLLNWFYALCLVRNRRRYRSKRSEVALERLMRDTQFRFGQENRPALLLLTHMDSSDRAVKNHVVGELSEFLGIDHTKVGSHLALAVLRYFKVSDAELGELGLSPTAVPVAMILRSELSPFVPTASPERQRLEKIYGGGSVIGAVPRKEEWENALTRLDGVLVQSQADARKEKRIIYFVDAFWITAILEQGRSAEDEPWGRDILLSRSHFIREGCDAMDAVDMKLAHALAVKPEKVADIDVLVPLLAGTGRVFRGQHNQPPYTPLPIEEETPFVAFSGERGAVRVSTNVQPRPDGTIPPVSVVRTGEGYTCVRTNPVQRDILAQLLGVGTFPVSALPALRRTIDALEGTLEVRSSLGSMAVIPTLRGSTRLDIRISPMKDDDGYHLEVSVAPYEDGELRCEPGLGEEDVYDDTGGVARFIRRDLQQEIDNYAELQDYLQTGLHLSTEEDFRWDIYANASLLGVLTWAFDHRDKCFVEWPEGRPLRFRGDLRAGDVEITVKTGIDWFAVEGQVKVGGGKYSLQELLEAMRASDVEGFVKLDDRDYVRMTRALQKHLEALEAMMNRKVGGTSVVPVYRVGALAEILGDDGGLHGTMDEGFKALLRRMQDAYDATPEVPSELRATLREYQREGYVWMRRLDAWGAGVCLADDMGLGKTVQTLAFLLSKASNGPSLVVAPKSVVPNWEIEAARFAPTLKVTLLNDASRREDCITAAGPGDVILMTYGILTSEAGALSSRRWNVICLDEAHQIKNRSTRVSAAAMALEGDSRIALTGTPLQNHLGELWNIFQFINPGLLGRWEDFRARYLCGEIDETNRVYLKDMVQPFILRRTKEEVLDELPEKIVCDQMIDLTPAEMELYEAMRNFVELNLKAGSKKKGKKKFGEGERDERKIQIDFFAELTKLRLAALSMRLVHDEWKGGSSKTTALLELLDRILSVPGNQVVVFSQFTSYLALVRIALDRRGIRYLYLDGQTELDERREVVGRFQDSDCPLLLASLKAGGLGLNLTAANHVILMDPWWNPAIESQAMDRAHRIGQRRAVTVTRLVARHTIEEKILRLHDTKRALSEAMLDGTAFSGHLSMDDILEMVSPFR